MPRPIRPDDLRKFFTREQAARELRVSLRTLDRWIGAGEVVVLRANRSVFISPSEIVRLKRKESPHV